MSTLDFWDSAADGVYDRFVLGVDAPYEIRRLLIQEDEKLMGIIESYFSNDCDVVLVEIGSGTGRYQRLFGRLIFTDERYNKHLRYVVGVDFSKSMIKATINKLVRSKSVNKKKESSLIANIKFETGLNSNFIMDTLLERIQLIHADAKNPCLKSLRESDP